MNADLSYSNLQNFAYQRDNKAIPPTGSGLLSFLHFTQNHSLIWDLPGFIISEVDMLVLFSHSCRCFAFLNSF